MGRGSERGQEEEDKEEEEEEGREEGRRRKKRKRRGKAKEEVEEKREGERERRRDLHVVPSLSKTVDREQANNVPFQTATWERCDLNQVRSERSARLSNHMASTAVPK